MNLITAGWASSCLAGLMLAASPAIGLQQTDPATEALVRRASQNELTSHGDHPYRYALHKYDIEKGSNTKEIVETKDGDVARLFAINDQPPASDAAEKDRLRLDDLMAHPEEQRRRHQKEMQDSQREDKMVKLLPDAFIYQKIGIGTTPSGPVIKLSMKPNPNFQPPDRESEVYHGMAGELWIDQRQERMVRMEAHLIADVDFGWGVLGKLYQGGSILVEQEDVGDGHWETNHLKLDLNGKILLVKPLTIKTEETAYDFHAVPPDMGYRDAIRLVQTMPAPALKP